MPAPLNPPPDPDPRPPRFVLPSRACDCHAHLFGPFDRFPVRVGTYEPASAPLEAYRRMHRIIRCERGVLVQPSPYGTDNAALVNALRSGKAPLRGIAVIAPSTPDQEIEKLHWAGVVGCRIHQGGKTDLPFSVVPNLARRVRRAGWHLQFYLSVERDPEIDRKLLALDLPIVLDHFGAVSPAAGLKGAGFQCLLRLARSGRCWFKLSAPYRITNSPPPWPEVTPIARALVEAAPDRCLWGTDWPHPNVARMPNDSDLVDLIPEWIPAARARQAVLVDNPAALYGF